MKEKFKSKLGIDKFQYEYCSELLWGGVVVDRAWAEDTKIFIDNYQKFLESYDVETEKKWKKSLENLYLVKANEILNKNIFSNKNKIPLVKWEIEKILEDVSEKKTTLINKKTVKKLNRKLFRYKFIIKYGSIFRIK